MKVVCFVYMEINLGACKIEGDNTTYNTQHKQIVIFCYCINLSQYSNSTISTEYTNPTKDLVSQLEIYQQQQ